MVDIAAHITLWCELNHYVFKKRRLTTSAPQGQGIHCAIIHMNRQTHGTRRGAGRAKLFIHSYKFMGLIQGISVAQ